MVLIKWLFGSGPAPETDATDPVEAGKAHIGAGLHAIGWLWGWGTKRLACCPRRQRRRGRVRSE